MATVDTEPFTHVVSIKDFLDRDLLASIFKTAQALQATPNDQLPQTLHHHIIACLFYEPSTRTRFSFETAVHRLGGETISTENAAEFSSTIKGETLEDTVKTLNGYVDGIVLRHPDIGSAQNAATVSTVPVFNAGDGGGEHPTQALLDLYTITRARGSAENLKVALVGDLLYGRTVHSLLYLLCLYQAELYLVAPPQLQLPETYRDYLDEHHIRYHVLENWHDVIDQVDVVYMTRIQKERFEFKEDFDQLRHSFELNRNTLADMKSDAIIMHPLPRNSEIATEVDADPRAIYFEQARNGLYLRMALLQKVYGNGHATT